MFLLVTLLLIALAFAALAVLFVPVFRAREFDKRHIPRSSWVVASLLVAAGIGLGLFVLPVLGP